MLISSATSLFKHAISRGAFPTCCLNSLNLISPRKNSSLIMDLEVNRIVWLDLEMTGLDVGKDTIMEIACIVTDTNLNIIAESPDLILHTPEERLREMNEWCTKQHGKTGLSEASKNSDLLVERAEEIILNFVKEHVTKNASPLAGNSVYMDRVFIQKYMPNLNDYLHYRIIDVSTIKELCRRWNYTLYRGAPKKDFVHRALSDIRESIRELKYYRNNFFNLENK